MKTFISLAVLIGFAKAACPNSCSSRGTCGADDVCTCYAGWKGGDCSYRICPYGPSWSVTSANELADDRSLNERIAATPGGYIKDNAGTADIKGTYEELYPKVPAFREYVECSGRGNCNYATGRCNCFAGFEGRGCRRTSCPNGCSGHGKCMTNAEANDKSYSGINIFNSQFWDETRTQQCVCDRGFQGYDCSERVCPYGDNPKSECAETTADDYQLVYVKTKTKDEAANTGEEYFTLRFKDQFGGTYGTRPINAHKCTAGDPSGCLEVQYALMDLPNFAIPDVEADLLDLKLGGGQQAYLIHFTNPANSGKQNTLECEVIADSDVNGASPKYSQVTACHVFHAGGPQWYNADGTKAGFRLNGNDVTREQVLPKEALLYELGAAAEEALKAQRYKEYIPCSGQGTCNTETGVCKCAEGTTGEGCRVATTYS